MASYDPLIIQKLADKLYTNANAAIATYTIAGVVVGAVAGLGVWHFFERFWHLGGIAVLVGGLLGYVVGAEYAFATKLKAQVALCQMQIEKNTAKSPGV